jgi:hypothetical protein
MKAVAGQIDRGVALPGLYPMNEDSRARYKASTESL